MYILQENVESVKKRQNVICIPRYKKGTKKYQGTMSSVHFCREMISAGFGEKEAICE